VTATPGPDDHIGDWIRTELDAVPLPQRAVDDAVRISIALRQRHPRRGVRAWLWDRDRARTGRTPDGTPEVVLTAPIPQAAATPTAASAAIPAPRRFVLATAATAIAVAATAFFVSAPSAGPSVPGSEPVRLGVMVLEPPVESGREILVAPDGTGHFYTISDAVNAAVDRDRITVMPGDYAESIQISGKDISVNGEGGPDSVVVRPAVVGPLDLPVGYANTDDFGGNAYVSELETQEADPWRYVLYLDETNTQVSNVSLIGSEIGSAIVIRGGAPRLDGLIVDPVGTQTDGQPTAPHEGVSIYGGSHASVRNSTITGLVSITGGSSPSFSNNTISGTCVIISGEGSDPTLSGNTIESSSSTGLCPRFNIAVNAGASPLIDSNDIVGDQRTDGIRVSGPDTAPTIQGNNITGGDSGIWVGGEARGLILRNDVTGAQTGMRIVGASPQVEINGFYRNSVGIWIDGSSRPQVTANSVCNNETNVILGPGLPSLQSQIPEICPAGPAPVGGG
jgi:hypothetical protein